MPKTQKAIKKIEKRVASNFTKGFGSFFKSIGMGFVRIGQQTHNHDSSSLTK